MTGDHWAPRTRKRHQQEHRPQWPTERSDPTQHAKGRTGDCPGPRKETATRRNVTQGGGEDVLIPPSLPPSPPPAAHQTSCATAAGKATSDCGLTRDIHPQQGQAGPAARGWARLRERDARRPPEACPHGASPGDRRRRRRHRAKGGRGERRRPHEEPRPRGNTSNRRTKFIFKNEHNPEHVCKPKWNNFHMHIGPNMKLMHDGSLDLLDDGPESGSTSRAPWSYNNSKVALFGENTMGRLRETA